MFVEKKKKREYNLFEIACWKNCGQFYVEQHLLFLNMPKSYYYDGVKRLNFSSGSPVNEIVDVTVFTLVDKILTIAVAEEIVDAVLEEALQLAYLSCGKGSPCRREAAPPDDAPVGDIPQLKCEIKKMISDISAQTVIVGQGDVEAANPMSSEELRRLVVMMEDSKEIPVLPARPIEFPVNENEVLETKDSWEEEQELEVRVIEPDYDSTCDEGSLQLQLPKQRMFWSSTGLVIGKDMVEEIVARAEKLMFPPQTEEEPSQEWVMVQDGGKGDEKDLVPSETPSCSSEDSPKKKTKGKKWKLGVRMRKFFSTALRRNSKSDRTAAVVKQ